ncbi:hypothetical protein [Polyangium mundeleinium]|uniref:Uncharacterized protein n=1 Tax=Polyangium mundeleinium TaxID=2995306 RepID=A0ABT5EGS6_9BACT|nr:hypothetical protein [Polyangium mundeleinium]MDC0741032.1 hypothetical protein [Polyangium mundeleinium]
MNLVGYHNRKRMGYPLLDRGPDRDPFKFMTKKPVEHLVGATVWAIEGVRGARMEYFLGAWFIIGEAGPSNHPSLGNYVRGTEGEVFERMIRLDDRPWFSHFRTSQGNFGFGLSPIQEEFVTHLEAIAAAVLRRAPG